MTIKDTVARCLNAQEAPASALATGEYGRTGVRRGIRAEIEVMGYNIVVRDYEAGGYSSCLWLIQ